MANGSAAGKQQSKFPGVNSETRKTQVVIRGRYRNSNY